ncbi:hypothetical protein [Clostridium sporogenes]|uniref:hypothetical protein n=1 Tax=Clostridium sporogenes TaxID=1509 RepID=UPI001969FA6F|nr:hypothetical protein [Clostridium sporogenes]
MIFLSRLTKITNEKYSIGYIHYMPFNEKHGLGKTKEELEQEGILLESIIEPKQIEGKQATMYWNPIEGKIFYEYEDIPKSKEETLEEKIKTLTENLAQEKINNMKKDALAVNLTKEVANLKVEVMNLKKGGNQ